MQDKDEAGWPGFFLLGTPGVFATLFGLAAVSQGDWRLFLIGLCAGGLGITLLIGAFAFLAGVGEGEAVEPMLALFGLASAFGGIAGAVDRWKANWSMVVFMMLVSVLGFVVLGFAGYLAEHGFGDEPREVFGGARFEDDIKEARRSGLL